MKIKTTNSEIIKAKFINSLLILEKYISEAAATDSAYYASSVKSRMQGVKAELLKDIEKLSKDVEVEEDKSGDSTITVS